MSLLLIWKILAGLISLAVASLGFVPVAIVGEGGEDAPADPPEESVLSVEDIEGLSDEKLDDTKKPDDGTGTAVETEAEKAAKAAAASGTSAADSPEAIEKKRVEAAAASAATAADANKLPSTYKTTDDLAKGLLNAGKVLHYSETALTALITLAKKTNDWTGVIAAYKEMDLLISKNQKAETDLAAKAAASLQPAQQATAEEEKAATLRRQMVDRWAADETLRAIGSADVMRRMAAKGFQLPPDFLTSKESHTAFMDKLENDAPAVFVDFKNEFGRLFREIQAEGIETEKATLEAPKNNTTMQAEEEGKIKEYAKSIGLPLTDVELKAVVEAAVRSPYSYEEKHGAMYLRPEAIQDYFYKVNRATIEKQIKLNGETAGRVQHAADMKELKNKTHTTLSTSPLNAKQRTDGKPVNVDDPDEVESASDEEIGLAAQK